MFFDLLPPLVWKRWIVRYSHHGKTWRHMYSTLQLLRWLVRYRVSLWHGSLDRIVYGNKVMIATTTISSLRYHRRFASHPMVRRNEVVRYSLIYQQTWSDRKFLFLLFIHLFSTHFGGYGAKNSVFPNLSLRFMFGVLSNEIQPFAWLRTDHPIQQDAALQVGLRIGLFGCLTTCKWT